MDSDPIPASCAASPYPFPTSTSPAGRYLASRCALTRTTPQPNSGFEAHPNPAAQPGENRRSGEVGPATDVADLAAAIRRAGSSPTEPGTVNPGGEVAESISTAEAAHPGTERGPSPRAPATKIDRPNQNDIPEPGAPSRGRPSETLAPQVEPLATQPFGEEIRLARAYLMRVAEPPATALLAFVDAVGPVDAAARVRAADVPTAVLAETSARRHLDLAAGDLVDAEQVGARLVVPEDEEWPAWQLLCLAAAVDRGQRWSGAPLGLWARGPASMADVFDRAVSVVGSRSATSYGEHVAAEVGHGLAAAGMTVVSGAAYGIDGSAHRGALSAEGRTIAVLACGVDIDYPSGHAALLERIADTGLVLSEYPPGTKPAKHRFLVRNRLIAALSTGTVVVEAGVRSGARNTATTAAALGKVVMAVPGPITSAMSVGCHDLLRTGAAILAGSVAEILEALGPVGEHLSERPDAPHRRTDGLGDDALRVHEALRRRTARTAAQVAVDSGVPLDRVRALLPELEITGLVERCEAGWCQAPD
jgi:DNA processing protein